MTILSKVSPIQPDTITAWHRRWAQKLWNYPRRFPGHPPLSDEIKTCVLNMKKANLRWGSLRISGELRKLGIQISKKSVATILSDHGFDPGVRDFRMWWNFLKSQGDRIFACDFFEVDTLFMKRLYVFFMIDIKSREVMFFGITKSPSQFWLRNLIRSNFATLEQLPEVLICDQDGLFGDWLEKFLVESYGMKVIHTPSQAPYCNDRAERMVGTFREELTDRVLVYNERDLHRLLAEYVDYYNKFRSHSARKSNPPVGTITQVIDKKNPNLFQRKILKGLITDFQAAI